jgi:hypothetical protein
MEPNKELQYKYDDYEQDFHDENDKNDKQKL